MSDAFSSIRSVIATPRQPNLKSKKFEDELLQMESSDGLMQISQHPPCTFTPTECPEVTAGMLHAAHLWVVRVEDAVHAPENCEYGQKLNNTKIKHTNLTGGLPAYCGGELLWINAREILVNGCSGRYGPKNSEEMQAVAVAFANAGYRVWSTGYDEGTARCFTFGASLPFEVTPS